MRLKVSRQPNKIDSNEVGWKKEASTHSHIHTYPHIRAHTHDHLIHRKRKRQCN